MKNLLALTLLMISGLAVADSSQLQINNAWIKQLPPVVPMRAGYMEIVNPTDQDFKLVGAESDDFEKAEMHETLMADGAMKMVQRESMDIPPKGKLVLQPGGKHLMLFTPARPLPAGEQVVITLRFDDGSSRPVTFTVKR